MLETQLATLAWNDLSRRAPMQTELLQQLTVLGLAHDLAGELVSAVAAATGVGRSASPRARADGAPHRDVGERWMEGGGVVALVGRDRRRQDDVDREARRALGAASWPARPRARVDRLRPHRRAGTDSHARSAARRAGVRDRRRGASSPSCSITLARRRLVLIDSAGLEPARSASRRASSKRSRTRASVWRRASCCPPPHRPARSKKSLERFAAARPTTCCVTKLDEATSLGGALSALIRSQAAARVLSDGQQVPEDLSPARAHQLIARAVELSKKAGAHADEDLLQTTLRRSRARPRMTS